MKVPRKFNLIGLEWQVRFESPMKDGLEQYGVTDFAAQVIRISPNISAKLQEQTFLHELLHAIWWQMGLDRSFNAQKEELVVNALSNGLYSALKETKLLNA